MRDAVAPGAALESPAAGCVGVVAIGRNEGERLERCLASTVASGRTVIYVDSGSTDGSIALAERWGVHAVALDMTRPFTAARARNEGMRALWELAPQVEYVQFIDGDCEMAPGWIETALAFMVVQPRVAVACGRVRERHPLRSVYNLLCDLEWNTEVGPAKACGGIALVRTAALREVGGFNDSLIAGEEPELCLRLRGRGWTVYRLAAEMCWHDAAMTRFSQWWKRTQRGGHAFAEGAFLHGASAERYWVRESQSAAFWGLILPMLIFAAAAVQPLALAGLLLYPLQVLRLALRVRGPASWRWTRAAFLVLGKFPEAAGFLLFHWRRWRGHAPRLIEYK